MGLLWPDGRVVLIFAAACESWRGAWWSASIRQRAPAENAALRAVIDELRAEIAELKRQLGQNSQNSSKPPSADSPFTKPAAKSLRRRSGQAGRSARASEIDADAG